MLFKISDLISLFFLLLLLTNCNNARTRINFPVTEDTTHVIGIKRDIPQSNEQNHSYLYPYIYTRKYEGLGGFKRLDNGFDSLCIRIRYNYSFENKEQVIEFRKTNADWEAEFFTLARNYYSGSDSIVSIDNKSVLKNPKSGWSKFINELLILDITTLPDESQIPGYNAPMDGNSITVQVATKYFYRIYNYSSPNSNTDIESAKKIEKVMELIEQEFGEKRLKNI